MKMFMFSLDGDAREWYRSFPPASISSLRDFHAAFNTQCQKFYSDELIHHSCCEEYRDGFQDIVRSCERCENEGNTSEELMELVNSFSATIEGLEADFTCYSYEENAKDIPFLEIDVIGNPSHYGEVEDCIAIEVEYSTPDAPIVSYLNEGIVVYSDEEQQSPSSQFVDLGSN